MGAAAAAKKQFRLLLSEAQVRSCGIQTISLLLGSDQRLRDHLFDSADPLRLRDTPQTIAADAWELNLERRVLVLAALDFHSGQGNVFLSELLKLNPKNLSRLINALMAWRSLRDVTDLSFALTSTNGPQP